MSLTSKIPVEIREQLAADPWMSHCLVAHECSGRIEWHHCWTYRGRRVNELYTIQPLCSRHHREMKKNTVAICTIAMRTRIVQFKAENTFKAKYPKQSLIV